MSIVICKLPAAGLGNQLFPLMKAAVFARLNGLPLYVTGYNRPKIGPYLRREKVKRKYGGFFTFQQGYFSGQIMRLSLLRYNGFEKVNEPPLYPMPPDQKTGKMFVFSSIPHWSDYFAGLKDYRDLVLSLFGELVHARIKDKVETLDAPCIGVHIRMGDFRRLTEGEDFRSAGAVRTPEHYFIEVISAIRKINRKDLPVSVFTDGYRHEFRDLFSLGGVTLVEGNPDLVDMLLLSRSRIIVTSAGSTFSYWAGFLSDAPLIMHPDHLHAPVRPVSAGSLSYEGPFDPGATGSLLLSEI
jgi:Glycosyl transferase family 11